MLCGLFRRLTMEKDVEFIKTRTELTQKLVSGLDYAEAVKFARRVWEMRMTTSKIIFLGNGASNTIANHAALDYMSQIGVTTIAVNDPAVLTAFANDFGYDHAWERYCKINFKSGDMLVAVSSSGRSQNVVNAAKYVKDTGGYVVAFTGFDEDNDLNKIANQKFWVDAQLYNPVESIHNLWLAMICDVLTEWMGDEAGLHGMNI